MISSPGHASAVIAPATTVASLPGGEKVLSRSCA